MWLTLAYGLAMLLVSVIGVGMTLATLPGTWFILLLAVVVEWLRDGTYSWWTLGVCLALAAIGELLELLAGSAGAAGAGGSKRAAMLSIPGAILGAILGTIFLPFLPIIGTIVGAVAGAGLFAGIGESTVTGRTWKDIRGVGRGAAIGRAWAVVIKGGIAALMGVILTIAAFA